jgi:hypothetical protein
MDSLRRRNIRVLPDELIIVAPATPVEPTLHDGSTRPVGDDLARRTT